MKTKLLVIFLVFAAFTSHAANWTFKASRIGPKSEEIVEYVKLGVYKDYLSDWFVSSAQGKVLVQLLDKCAGKKSVWRWLSHYDDGGSSTKTYGFVIQVFENDEDYKRFVSRNNVIKDPRTAKGTIAIIDFCNGGGIMKAVEVNGDKLMIVYPISVFLFPKFIER